MLFFFFNMCVEYIYMDTHSAPHCTTLHHPVQHCTTRQHTTTHCSTLQPTATHCNTLLHTAAHCITLQHTATCCNTLQHTATHCNTLQHTATYGNTQCMPIVDATDRATFLFEYYMHIYAYMHTYVCIHMYVCIYMYTCTYTFSIRNIIVRVYLRNTICLCHYVGRYGVATISRALKIYMSLLQKSPTKEPISCRRDL